MNEPLGKIPSIFSGFCSFNLGFFVFPGKTSSEGFVPNGEALGVTELAQLVEAVQASPLLNLTEQDTKVRCFEGGWMGGGMGGNGIYMCVFYLYFFNNNNDNNNNIRVCQKKWS